MGSKQQKEEKLLDTIILPPQPISGLHTLANGISKDNLMVSPGLCRLPQITNAFSKYFDAHSKYERGRAQRAIERLISRRARDADQQRNKNQRQEKKNDFEERPEEKKALEELIQMLQVFLVETNKDKQPYLEEHDIDKLRTLAGSCMVRWRMGIQRDVTRSWGVFMRTWWRLLGLRAGYIGNWLV